MSKIRFLLLIGLITISFLLPAHTLSEDCSLEKTINHLLKYIKESRCAFIRNDKEHGSEFAAEHIKKKYDYFKDKIKTPEQFIELCAARSSMSGKPYLVRCKGNNKIPSADWLMAELENYRSKISQANPPN